MLLIGILLCRRYLIHEKLFYYFHLNHSPVLYVLQKGIDNTAIGTGTASPETSFKMASFDKKRFEKSGQVYCYFYSKEKKQIWLPRRETKYLDHGPTHNIEHFCHQLALKYEMSSNRSYTPKDSAIVEPLIEKFFDHMRQRVDESTANGKITYFKKFVIPYFTQNTDEGPGCRDFSRWPDKSHKLYRYVLSKSNESESLTRLANTCAQSFWRFLRERGDIPSLSPDLPLISPPKNRVYIKRREYERMSPETRAQILTKRNYDETPLRFTISVDEMLGWAKQQPDKSIRLLGLIGYFASLRTQELFALTPESIVCGGTSDKYRIMTSYSWRDSGVDLNGGMYIRVLHQADRFLNLKPCKARSRAHCVIFHREAADMISSIVDDLKKRGRIKHWLFPHSPSFYGRRWREVAPKPSTLKDLRRASIWELAHFSNIDQHGLMTFARHREPKTTALYFRTPFE